MGVDLPEGSRLQLDPALTTSDFERMGLSAAAQVVARGLQDYGMIVIDTAGSTKLIIEDERTADWGGLLSRTSPSALPLDNFGVIAP